MFIKTNGQHIPLLFVWSLLLSLPQGCASIAKEYDSGQVAKQEIGQSTKEEVLASLGLPNERELETVEEYGQYREFEFWIYYKGKGGKSYTGFVGAAPVGNFAVLFGSKKLTLRNRGDIAAILVFDEDGILVDIKTEKNWQ